MGGILISAGFWGFWTSESISKSGVRRLSIIPEAELGHNSLALSPDGEFLAYIAHGNDGRNRIYLRSMQTGEVTSIAETEDAEHPFFSPDGQWVAYFDNFQGKLKKISITGGEPVVLAECSKFRGGTWGTDDCIIFAPSLKRGLWRISATGKELEQLTHKDPNIAEGTHCWPQALPDGEHVLFTTRGGGGSLIEVYSLKTGRRHVLIEGGSYARYLPTGHIVYGHQETLYAVACNLTNLEVGGSHVPVVQGVRTLMIGSIPFTFSQADGSLAYIPLTVPNKNLEPVWVTENGSTSSLGITKRNYHSVSISPDGAYAAFRVPPLYEYVGDLWIYDLEHRTEIRLARDISMSTPVWTPDSNEVIYMTYNPWELYRQKIDGSEEPKLIGQFKKMVSSRSCSPDGKVLLADRDNDHLPMMFWDIWTVPLDEGSTVTAGPVIERYGRQHHGTWSPDGRWIVYVSNESGRSEVYIEPYPGPGPRTNISLGHGDHPVWSRDGTKLFYRRGENKMVSATIETEPKLRVTERKELFDWKYLSCWFCQTYDVAPDGRLLMIRDPEGSSPQRISIVLNWFDELKRLVPSPEAP
jgi:serine/threonine-protein kinase